MPPARAEQLVVVQPARCAGRADQGVQVVDDGATHRGTAEILRWLRTSASEYTYTTQLTGAQRIDDDRWIARHHLEGDFPGGVVDLHFRFTLRGDQIAELVISP